MKKKLTLLGVLVVSFLFCLVGVKATEYKTYTIGEEIKFNPITGKYCESGNNCFIFNVVNVGENSDYYEMMLNYNLIANSTWGNTTDGPTVAVNELKEATKDWLGIETYTSEDNIVLPSSSGSYTVNYNGSKARMITAQEIAAIYNYETVGGSTWVWNDTSTSNNIKSKKTHSWLTQNLGDNVYSDISKFGHVYDYVQYENGHYPFNYYTSSVSNSNSVYVAANYVVVLEPRRLDFDFDHYDSGLRPVVKLKKQIQEQDYLKTQEVLIKGPKVVIGNTIPELNELEIPFGLIANSSFWTKVCDNEASTTVLPGEKFLEGCSYNLIIVFFFNDNINNKNVDISSDDIVFKYNNSLASTIYNSGTLVIRFEFENLENITNNEELPQGEEVVTTTKKETVKVKNPKTSDSIMNIIAIMALTGAGTFITVKKIKNN